MNPLLAQLTRSERIEERLELARWSSGNALLVGAILTAAGIYAIYWLYRREARGQVSRAMRGMMIACRVLLLLTLGLIGLEPVLVKYIHRRLEGTTLVLVDSSASMSLSDPYRYPEDRERVRRFLGPKENPEGRFARSDLAARMLDPKRSDFLSGLSRRNSVKVFSFSDAPALLAQWSETGTADAGHKADVQPATGAATDIGLAVRGAISAAEGSPIAGVVVLSDGQFNQGESPEVIAAMLKQKAVPAYTVGIGDPGEPVNAAVVEVNTPRSAFKNDPFSVTVRVSARGLQDQPLNVELLEKTEASATPIPVETRTARPNEDGSFAPLVFQRKVSKPGPVTYIARIEPLNFEAIASDNQRQSIPPVDVLDDKMRILLVAGSPSYDYRYLARMLERDKAVDVSCWLQSADVKAVRDGTTIITELPSTAEEIYKYDAILLLDVDPAMLDTSWATILSTFVTERGGGLLYEAGNKYSGKFFRSPTTGPIVELLPVVPDPDAEIIINEQGYSQARAWPIGLVDAAANDPILRLTDNPTENRAVWSALDGVYWHYPVRREKPVAQVLMRHSDPRMAGSFGQHVLFATQFAGAGRTAYLGFNSTWRWRKGDDKLFTRFWTQVLRYLVEGKLLGGKSRCQIQTAKDQFQIGESVVVTVTALDEKFAPILAPQLDLSVTAPAQVADQGEPVQTIVLAPMPGREGSYQGRFIPGRAGTWQLSLKLPGQSVVSSQRDLAVTESDLEMRNTPLNKATLRQFAEASGGRYFDMDDAGKLPELIPDRSRTYVVRERPRMLWDNGYLLTALVALVSVEWILRKKAKLL
ncbi:MAG TPA: vWA domain-containing protein [Phycisphaerae bacterium]|nr:vWA domain-containing protein [Phycisphaerae bacterium]